VSVVIEGPSYKKGVVPEQYAFSWKHLNAFLALEK